MNPFIELNNEPLTPEQQKGSIDYTFSLMEEALALNWYFRDAVGKTITKLDINGKVIKEVIEFYDGRLWCERMSFEEVLLKALKFKPNERKSSKNR